MARSFFKKKSSKKARIRRLSDEILPGAASNFSPGDLEKEQVVIHEFLDNREWGLALEHLLYLIGEYEISMTTEQKTELRKLSDAFTS